MRSIPSGFINLDVESLQSEFDVELLHYRRPSPLFLVRALRSAARNDALYSFFASEHTLVPAIAFAALGKPLILAPAGYDFANDPVHRYGLAARRRGWLPRFLAGRATSILACSRTAQEEILALAPAAASKTEVVYLGADPKDWDDPGVTREDSFVTLAHGTVEAWSRKGLDRFVALAVADPDHRYVLAGRLAPEVQALLPSPVPANLELTGFLTDDELRRLLWSASVYVQLSWHESFGMAVLEAMLCGCVPLISEVRALHEVAGDWAVTSSAPTTDRSCADAALKAPVDRAALRADASLRFPAAARQRAVVDAVRAALR